MDLPFAKAIQRITGEDADSARSLVSAIEMVHTAVQQYELSHDSWPNDADSEELDRTGQDRTRSRSG